MCVILTDGNSFIQSQDSIYYGPNGFSEGLYSSQQRGTISLSCRSCLFLEKLYNKPSKWKICSILDERC